MKWIEETHGTKFELIRHFLARMFDSEMFSTRGQWWTVAVSAFALAIPAGFLLLDPPYYHRPVDPSPENLRAVAIADELALLTFILAITGILALLAWQSLFPSRRDYLALAGLPVRSRQIFAARFASVLLMAGAIALATSLLPSLMVPHQFTAHGGPEAPALANALARAASSSLGCLFVFFAIVAIQGLLINALPARLFSRFSTYVQGALIAVFFLAGLYSWFIVDWRQQTIARLPDFGAWAPPVWFAGLHRAIIGDRNPFFAAMAARGLAATAGAVVVAGLMYVVAYSRYRKLLLESPDAVAHRRIWKWSFLRLLALDPRREAVIQFVVNVLSRSRVHRLVLMAYLGAGLAIMVNSTLIAGAARKWSGGSREILRFAVSYWPIGLSFVVLAGVRHAFSMPAEWQANWLFRIAESQGRREWMTAVERFVIVCVIAPIHLLTLPVAAAVLGWPVAARMTVLESLVSLSAFELLFYSWQQLPFTCSYVPGKRPLTASLASWGAVLIGLVPVLSRIIAALSQMLEVFLFYVGFFAAVWLWARRRRRDGWGEAPLIYEDLCETVPDLGIKELSYRGPAPEPALETRRAPETAGDGGRVMTHPANRPVAISLRLYRALARAFPYEFKNAYGEELVQVAEDAIEPIWRRHGVLGLVRLLADLAVRVPAEHLAELRQDIRYGLRTLAGSPGFTAVALISLSLGISAAASIASQLNALVLRDLPGVPRPGELVMLHLPASYPQYRRYREMTDLFSSTMAYVAPVPFGLSTGGHSERVWGHLVTPSYFPTLGLRPLLGRFFDESRAQAVVVSHRFWQNRLGSDPSAIGKTLRVNGHPCVVIGVGPKDFLGASPVVYAADLWMPLAVGEQVAPELAGNALERRDLAMFQVVGRLKPGVTLSGAEAELDAAARQLALAYGEQSRTDKGRRVLLLPAGKMIPMRKNEAADVIRLMSILAGLVLLIAVANVGNIMLARAADRRKEIAVRLAMGASRARLVRQLLTESMLVAAGAGTLGFLLSIWLTRLWSQVRVPYPMPVAFDLTPDFRVLLFTVGLTVFTGLAFGLAPAFQATRIDLTPALKEGGDVRFRRHRRLSLRNLLMVHQVALSLALLMLTAFLVLGFRRSAGLDVGFDPRNLYLISMDPMREGYSGARAAAFFEKLLDRVKGLPSVTAASLTDTVPVAMNGNKWTSFYTSGPNSREPKVLRGAVKCVVGPGYFETLGVPILTGRGFRKQDEAEDAPAVIVSEKAAREFWKGEDPLGRQIDLGSYLPGASMALFFNVNWGFDHPSAGRRVFEVVGVARDTKIDPIMAKTPPVVYFPLRAADYGRPFLQGVTLIVRSAPGAGIDRAVRRQVQAIDAGLSPFNARSMMEQVDQFTLLFRVVYVTYGCMGLFGLVLASVGLAGVTAYSVARRRREIGIRVALGANRSRVLGLVMREGGALVAVGTVIGLAFTWAGRRVLGAVAFAAAKSFEESLYDMAVTVGAPLLLAALAMAACYVPARKSTRIDPVVALRQE